MIWEGRFVSEGVLAEGIHEARRALGEEPGKGVFIRTVHGRGYQFVFRPVEVATARNEPSSAGKESPSAWTGGAGPTLLQPGENFIGRDATCLIVLVGLLVSRRHAGSMSHPPKPIVHDPVEERHGCEWREDLGASDAGER